MKDMRLSLFIAKSGYASRRHADRLIAQGCVQVNGVVCTQPFYRVQKGEVIVVEGKKLVLQEKVYLAFHKPRGVTTTRRDELGRRTVMDCLPAQLRDVFPVGRLDKDSTGLLILTNDGDFCFSLTHPQFEVEKEYRVHLQGSFPARDCRQARVGVRDEGDLLKVKKIRVLTHRKASTVCQVVVTEGKKRHLRRLFKQLGFRVQDLARIRVGKVRLGSLPQGCWRPLRSRER